MQTQLLKLLSVSIIILSLTMTSPPLKASNLDDALKKQAN